VKVGQISKMSLLMCAEIALCAITGFLYVAHFLQIGSKEYRVGIQTSTPAWLNGLSLWLC
jgi:hypothetical protein